MGFNSAFKELTVDWMCTMPDPLLIVSEPYCHLL